MFIHLDCIREAISELEYIHPFYGITFLVCKKEELPIGNDTEIAIQARETDFLDQYFKPFDDSEFFFRLFRVSDKLKLWVHRTKYAGSTLQSIRTQSAFSKAFIHSKGSASWGWRTDYLGVLRANLSYNLKQYKNNKVPLVLLASWLFREREWPQNAAEDLVVNTFINEFNLSTDELDLFDTETKSNLFSKKLFGPAVVSQLELREIIGPPPDAEQERGETLALLELQDVGPMTKLKFEPAERLNLITGDNGLGKSFLLECVWWALTGQWKSKRDQAAPDLDKVSSPTISFQIAGPNNKLPRTIATFDRTTQSWSQESRDAIEGVAIYARVDGSFAIWNPVRQRVLSEQNFAGSKDPTLGSDLNISSSEVWSGIPGQIQGLLDDWVEWQTSSDDESPESTFETLKRVLLRLSPPDLGPLEPGEPRRLPFDSRKFPTIKHSYGEVPVIYESAAVRRILALAYLLVWTWNEHLYYSSLVKSPPERRMVVMVDEIESHLHPLWQRMVLPALLDYSEDLPLELKTQFFIATHSPLVMASAETIFKFETDGLFHLNLTEAGEVKFSEVEFVRYGTVDAWLTSNVFDLRHARSFDADQAIERAKSLQRAENPLRADIEEVSAELERTLAADDAFWSRWIYFAEKYGVSI